MKATTAAIILSWASAIRFASAQALPEDKSFAFNALPHTWRTGQTGYNDCAAQAGSSDPEGTNMCQTAVINSVEDFCLWGPPVAGSEVGATEEEQVAYCTNSSHSTRVFPAGAITGAHFVQTSQYIQVTGVGDFTKINIKKGDSGGELDPYGATLQGNPVGGLVYSSAFGGGMQQVHVWTNFMSDSQFCFRACWGAQAPIYCQHIYDEQGCDWNMPANYAPNVYEQCVGDPDQPMGVYGTSTWYQAQSGSKTTTPPAHPIAKSSQCTTYSTIGQPALSSSSILTTLSSSSIISLSTTAPSSTLVISSASSSISVISTAAAITSAAQLVASTTSVSATDMPMATTTASGSMTHYQVIDWMKLAAGLTVGLSTLLIL